MRERVDSAREQLLKRPWALEGTSVAAMDVARATNRVTRRVTWVKRRRGSTPSAAGLIFYLAGHVDGSALSKYLRKYADYVP